jgi:hypothetical protein
MFGLQLARAMWIPHGAFLYPLELMLWGFLGVLYSFKLFGLLNNLGDSVAPDEANIIKASARHLMVYIFCTALISFGFGICAGAARFFGGFHVVAAIALGMVMILAIFLTARKIKHLSESRFRLAGYANLR